MSLLIKISDLCLAFQNFHKMTHTHYQKQIRVWQSDNGTEFMDVSLGNFLRNHGIRHQTSCTYAPQQNGLAERKNRQLLEVVHASLFGMNMPRFYGVEVVKSVAYLINRTPSQVIDFQTPQQKLQSLLSIPHLPNLEPRVFGCTVYVHIPKILRNKLDPCAKRCVFVGYSEFQKGYRCYDPQTRKLHVTLDASFRELEPYYSGGVSKNSLQRESSSEENGGGDEFIELENIQQESGGGDEFIELEKVNEHFKHVVQQGCDHNHETGSESPPIPSELPPSTPLTKESTQNVPPQVSMNPVFGESNETYVPAENTS